MERTDVVVIGGGPAGSACAARLRQLGVDCLVLDQRPFPRPKPCAGWITPEVVSDLALAPGEYPCGLTTYRSAIVWFRGRRITISNHQHAIRRLEFDDWLLRRSGAPVRQHAVRSIIARDGGFEIDGAYACRAVVGAGGTHCPVYRTFFHPFTPRPKTSLIAALEDEFAWPHEETTCRLWFWKGLKGYAWYVPKAGGYVNAGVGAWSDSVTSGGQTLREHWQRLVERLDGEGLVRGCRYAPVGHSYYLRRPLTEVRKGQAYVVGDAAGLATMDLGEGIGPAIRSGTLAAEAIARGTSYSVRSIRSHSLGPVLGRLVRALCRLNAPS